MVEKSDEEGQERLHEDHGNILKMMEFVPAKTKFFM